MPFSPYRHAERVQAAALATFGRSVFAFGFHPHKNKVDFYVDALKTTRLDLWVEFCRKGNIRNLKNVCFMAVSEAGPESDPKCRPRILVEVLGVDFSDGNAA